MDFIAGPSNITDSNTTASESPSSNSVVDASSFTDLNRERDKIAHVAGQL